MTEARTLLELLEVNRGVERQISYLEGDGVERQRQLSLAAPAGARHPASPAAARREAAATS